MITSKIFSCKVIGVHILILVIFGQSKIEPGYTASLEAIRIGDMSVDRATHQAILLESGKVLITGGCAGRGCSRVLSSAEIYNPRAGTFRAVASMSTPRAGGEAIALPDGRVLVTGGWTGDRVAASAEIYDPATDRWTSAGEMSVARMSHMIVDLADGRVLVVGGDTRPRRSLSSAEIFDPVTSAFTVAGEMQTPRGYPGVVSLADGRVLITGGHRISGGVLRSAEIFDPATGEIHPTGDMAATRTKHAAVLLHDGRVLIVGGSDGRDGRGRLASTEFYDPGTGRFSPGPTMHSPRHKIHDAVVVLSSGAVLVAGGSVQPEVWIPGEQEFRPVQGQLEGQHEFATATILPSGEVLVLGGYGAPVQSLTSAWKISVQNSY
jgi:hypothetical protein